MHHYIPSKVEHKVHILHALFTLHNKLLGFKERLAMQLLLICFQNLTMPIQDPKSIFLWCKIALKYPK